mmetsp:Transcript_27639/g.80100  ORF Transcript_27639/g.80100 Transcript_27639/m.80100 type:complete len:373 (-) Transcript_27639:150-1268(-)
MHGLHFLNSRLILAACCCGALELLRPVVFINLAKKHLEAELHRGSIIGLLVQAAGRICQALRRCRLCFSGLFALQRFEPLALLPDEGRQVLQRELPGGLVQHEACRLGIEPRSGNLDTVHGALGGLRGEDRVLRLQRAAVLLPFEPLDHARHVFLSLLHSVDLQFSMSTVHDLVAEQVGGARSDNRHRHRIEIELRDVELQLHAGRPVTRREKGDNDLGGAIRRDHPLEGRDGDIRMALQNGDLVLELDRDRARQRYRLRLFGAYGDPAEIDEARQLDVVRRRIRMDRHDQVLRQLATKDFHRVVIVPPFMRRENHRNILAHARGEQALLVELDPEPLRRGADDLYSYRGRRDVQNPKDVRVLLVDLESTEV